MGLLKTIRTQLGLSNTATQNFTLTAEAADGTMKLARGNAGATTQDIITVDSSGLVNFPQGLSGFLGSNQSLNTNGYQKLPGGLIIQWGVTGVMNRATAIDVNLPISFPTIGVCVTSSIRGNLSGDTASAARECGAIFNSNSQIKLSYNDNVSGSAVLFWFAIGY